MRSKSVPEKFCFGDTILGIFLNFSCMFQEKLAIQTGMNLIFVRNEFLQPKSPCITNFVIIVIAEVQTRIFRLWVLKFSV